MLIGAELERVIFFRHKGNFLNIFQRISYFLVILNEIDDPDSVFIGKSKSLIIGETIWKYPNEGLWTSDVRISNENWKAKNTEGKKSRT